MAEHKDKAAWAAAILAIGITGYSAWRQLVTGVLFWHIRQPEFLSMMLELLVVWVLLFLSFSLANQVGKRRIGVCAGSVILLGFFWLHKLMLPVLFTAVYTGYLIVVGWWFQRLVLRKPLDLAWNFLIGSIITLLVFCLLSLLQAGGIFILRIYLAASGCLLAVLALREMLGQKRSGIDNEKCLEETKWTWNLMLAAIVVLVLLQAGRMNLAVDFDSIWYGVRSDTMLNSGHGIYEDLKTLGVVYTYSKGFETLLLPLAGLPSYSFTIAMNLWIAGLLLYASYRTARICVPAGQALWVPFLMAATPGIMNMADTAKADLLTVFCQVLMVQAVMQCVRKEDALHADWLAAGLAAGGMSLTLKPTAIVYSTAAVGMSMLWLLWNFVFGKKQKWEQAEAKPERSAGIILEHPRIWCLFLLSVLVLAGIWGRTLRLVGVPVTSIFYGAFQKLGFQVKYPFYASGFPSAGSSGSLQEQVLFLLRRLYGVLLNPQGEDMAHVIIAWGTVLPVVWMLFWCFLHRVPKKNDSFLEKIGSYFRWLLFPIGAVNLVSLYSLSQIDGNYYMFTYVLMILAGVIWLTRQNEAVLRCCKSVLLLVWIYGVCLCGLTNWAWALGNGGIDFINRGYYPHQELHRQERVEQGSGEIWNILAVNPRNRVIALGEVPMVWTFPCWVQSYVDISGYWGNPDVVSNKQEFLKYLHFAEIDYLYMEQGYLDTSVRIYKIIRSLVEDGWLYDVRDENGNLILSVRKQTAEDLVLQMSSGEKMKNLNVFDWRYIQHL